MSGVACRRRNSDKMFSVDTYVCVCVCEYVYVNCVVFVFTHTPTHTHGRLLWAQYAANGDLQNMLDHYIRTKTYVAEKELWRLLRELSLAVQHLHVKVPPPIPLAPKL